MFPQLAKQKGGELKVLGKGVSRPKRLTRKILFHDFGLTFTIEPFLLAHPKWSIQLLFFWNFSLFVMPPYLL